jgi:fructose-bisphosphate aldolase class II
MNVDTDTQFAYLIGIRDFVLNKKGYLMSQVGNPDGADKPNKKYYETLAERVKVACQDLGDVNQC